ncbi:MAG: hypothetical protein A2958_01030 [Candidatus Levybacteria bacterium RIFCSPLOWO2_01_FULL_38_13]|nr:MAG: hypothetical protein A2629_00925 [Candidatus Levybacteria bacterium RIFCSPHIGHO2_01_FULL_41_15]OGH34871.1 MAG: hypothetical protein A2958_01030 [Candidatus Levybacteria bacterium RIFCSPLOWO2_01_FULL_38_13]
MIKGIEGINFFSSDAAKLSDFYVKKIGLKVSFEGIMGEHDESIYVFEMKSGSNLYIIDHSEVKGKNKNPQRTIINFEVDDIKKDVRKLKKEKVKLVQDIYHVEDYGFIATFEDPEGNYFQLVQTKSS